MDRGFQLEGRLRLSESDGGVWKPEVAQTAGLWSRSRCPARAAGDSDGEVALPGCTGASADALAAFKFPAALHSTQFTSHVRPFELKAVNLPVLPSQALQDIIISIRLGVSSRQSKAASA
jgi:hypothetical protein